MEVFKFPFGGYDVTIMRKADVLDCIDTNIVDKEVALDLIKKLEIDITEFLIKGITPGIPSIGTIRPPLVTKVTKSKEYKDIVASARAALDKESYIMFRKKLDFAATQKAKYDEYYRWTSGVLVKKNTAKFRALAEKKGEAFARFYIFSTHNLVAVDNNVTYYIDGTE